VASILGELVMETVGGLREAKSNSATFLLAQAPLSSIGQAEGTLSSTHARERLKGSMAFCDSLV